MAEQEKRRPEPVEGKPAAKKPAAKASESKAAPKAAEKKAPAKKATESKAAPKTAAAKKDTAAKTAAKSAASSASKAAPKAAASKSTASKSTASKATGTKAATASKAAAKPAEKPAAKAEAKEPAKAPAKKSAPKAKPAAAARPHVLKMHHLRPAPGAKTAKTRVGRGEASKGKTAGRGTKGTKARNQVRIGMEGGNLNAVMRAPKLRGFNNPFRTVYQVVNLDRLAELYPKGGDVTVSDLVAKGAVRGNEKVKVLGNGDIDVKLNVAVDKVSSSAEQKIKAAGGSVA